MQTIVKIISVSDRSFLSTDRQTGLQVNKTAKVLHLTDGLNTMVADLYDYQQTLQTGQLYTADLRITARKSQDGRLFNSLTIMSINPF